jgi:L-rhamnose mutarotase
MDRRVFTAPRAAATDMETIAFRMFLNPGAADEYRRRHDAIWPELLALLRDCGISDYGIWLDEEHHVLFATLRRRPGHAMDSLPGHPLMQRWWAHMRDLMRTNPDGSPVVEPLPRVFHMP